MKGIPLSILAQLFGLITRIRNYCYDKAWLKSFSFVQKNIVVVGNLAVGGTGKSPFVNYLLQHWPEEANPVVLSRGYGRKTKGFIWANTHKTADRIGDEPLTYRLQFPKISIALGENRVDAIQRILFEKPSTNSILLDDAFQHRALKASLNIVCTTYQRPFDQDELLPKGRLREGIEGIKRAHAIVMNRCPKDITKAEMNQIRFRFQTIAQWEIPVFFTGIIYGSPTGSEGNSLDHILKWSAIAGIAHPELFFQQIADQFDLMDCQTFPDHYQFSSNDLDRFEAKAAQMPENHGYITTFKDYVRLMPNLKKLPQLNKKLGYLPMQIYFIDQETEFLQWFAAELQKNK